MVTHLTSHAQAFEQTRRIGRCTHRTRGTESVVLTVRFIADAAETVAFDNTLEAFSFRGTDDIDKFAFLKDVDGQHFAVFFLVTLLKARELSEVALGGGVGFSEMAAHGLGGTAFLLFAEGELDSIVAVLFLCSDLCDDTRTSLNNCARYLLTVGIEKASHSDFFT